jgi:hypothetical protein
MIAEDVLERGLAAAADDYEVPPGAVDRVREQLAPRVEEKTPHQWRPSRRGWYVIGAGIAAGLIALPFAFGGASSLDKSVPAAGARSEVADAGGRSADNSDSPRLLSGAARSPQNAPAIPDASSADTFAPPAAAGSATGSSAGSSAPNQPGFVPRVQERVIKTGQLDLQVPKGEVSHTLDRLTGLATLMHGYVANSRTSEGGFAPSGQVTMRVPVANFESTISRARTYGSKVLALETAGQDVTNKYVDLAARIRALKATRATFLDLLAKATTIGETLSVQQHVTDVQTQIEQLQGQLRVLANRSSLSTLTVTVDQKVVPVATTTHHQSGISKAFHRSVDRFLNGVEAIVAALGPILLAVLLIGFGWLAARFGYRVLRRRMV